MGRQLWPSVRREDGELELMLVPEDVEGTVEPSTEHDIGARRGQRCIRSLELDEASVE